MEALDRILSNYRAGVLTANLLNERHIDGQGMQCNNHICRLSYVWQPSTMKVAILKDIEKEEGHRLAEADSLGF